MIYFFKEDIHMIGDVRNRDQENGIPVQYAWKTARKELCSST